MGSALVLFRSKWKVGNMFRKQARGFWRGCYTEHRWGSWPKGAGLSITGKHVTSEWQCLWPPEKVASVDSKNMRIQSLRHWGKWKNDFNQSSKVELGEPRWAHMQASKIPQLYPFVPQCFQKVVGRTTESGFCLHITNTAKMKSWFFWQHLHSRNSPSLQTAFWVCFGNFKN